MNYRVELDQEDDGRWIAEIPELPGVLAYGNSAKDAATKAQVMALRVIAERLEHNEEAPHSIRIELPAQVT